MQNKDENVKVENKNIGFFSGSLGKSSRRLVGIISGILTCLDASFILVMKFLKPEIELNWPLMLVTLSVPAIICILMFFFTSWSDVSKVIKFQKIGTTDGE